MFKKTLVAACGVLALTLLQTDPVSAQSRTGDDVNAPPIAEGGGRTRSSRRNARQPAAPTPEAIKAEAEAVLAAAATDCTVTDQRLLGNTADGAKFFEVACEAKPGYLLISSTPPQAIDCVLVAHTAAQNAANGTAETLPAGQGAPSCDLPGNQDIQGFLKAYAVQAGVPCTVDEIAVRGQNSSGEVIYEAGCAGADGYWIEQAADGWKKTECLQVMAQQGQCGFTTVEEQSATVKSWLVGSEAAACNVGQVRLMGQNANGRFIEVTCDGSEGFIFRHDNDFNVQQVYACSVAQAIGDGCNLPGNKQDDVEA